MPIGVDCIIDRLGGAEAAARLTGVGTEAVRKWRQAGLIPSRHWAAVINATGLALADLPGGPAAPRLDRSPDDSNAGPVWRHGGTGVGRRQRFLGPRVRRAHGAIRSRWAKSASIPG